MRRDRVPQEGRRIGRRCAVPDIVARLGRIATDTASEREAINASRVLLSEARAWRDHRWLTERLEAVEEALDRQRRRTP